jgi:transglutaminase-like putative cysteine protease
MTDIAVTDTRRWLQPTEFLDFDHPAVSAFAADAVGGATDPTDRAVRLFYRIRDGWWYDPYGSSHERPAFRASHVVQQSSSWCVPKSILYTAAARAAGIPARLGFADVRNHLQSEKLREQMGTDLFVFHGYTELLLDGRWLKASTAFNIELCERFGTRPLEFDGTGDALLHPFDHSGNRHMEYVRDRGSYDDFPYEEMTAAFEEAYGPSEPTDGPGGDGGGAHPDAAFAPPPR